MFAGTSNGIYRSTDYGSTWLSTQSPAHKIIKIAVGPAYLMAADTLNIYKSVNNGLNWSTVIFHSSIYHFQDLAICNNTALASTTSDLFYSTNSGTTWLSQNLYTISDVTLLCVNGSTVIAIRNTGVALVSSNCGISWTGYTNMGGNSIIANGPNCFISSYAEGPAYYPQISNGIYFSTDNGSTWTYKTNGLRNSSINSIVSSGNNVICGNNGDGLFVSTDQGSSWNKVNSCRLVSMDSHGNNVLASTSSGLLYSTNSGTTWDSISNMGGTALHFVGTDIFARGCGGSGPLTPVYLSRDTARTWTVSTLRFDMECVGSIVNIDSNIFASTGYIFLSTNYGSSWDTGYVDGNYIVADTISGIFAGGWNSTSQNYPGIIRSTNNGQSWFPANTGIPSSCNINSLILNGSDIYAGTNLGVYKSTNQGANWFPMNSGFPSGIDILSLSVNGNDLYAASNFDGVWKYSLIPANVKPLENDDLQSFLYPNPFNSSATIQYSLVSKSCISIKVYDISGKEIKTLLFTEQNPGKYFINVSAEDINSGIYFYRILTEHSTEIRKMIIIK